MQEKERFDAIRCAELIGASKNTVALTGAGISTSAGLADFRGPHGLYVTRQYDPETVFDIHAFSRDPAPFYEFTRDFLGVLENTEPTFTHRFLADLEEQGRLTGVITQNIDFLHQRAGSKKVIAVHGDYWNSHCLSCQEHYILERMEELMREAEVPLCTCGGVIKPDVVFFGEAVLGLDEAALAVASCDLLLVLGSSLMVYPAAFLPVQAGGDVVVVNKGDVGLAPGQGRYFVEADLDEFFSEVAKHL